MRILRLFRYRNALYIEAALIILFFSAGFLGGITLWCPKPEFFNSQGGHIDYACVSLGFLIQRFAWLAGTGYIVALIIVSLVPPWRREIFKVYTSD